MPAVPGQVVIEISELENVLDPEGFASAISPLRDLHFQIAIDDFGAGFANVRHLVELGPEFLKIDRPLVTCASRHPRKRAFLETIAHLGQRVNCAVIAEGVETEDDLATVRVCGIRFDRLPAIATLEQAAEVVRRRPAYRRFDPLVVENEAGGYHGLLPVDRLLAQMTRLKVVYALH